MPTAKRIRIIKKILENGAKRFISLTRTGLRYRWDPRPGTYYLEWWEGAQRRREVPGDSPSAAIAAQRRKQIELADGSPTIPPPEQPLKAEAPAARMRNGGERITNGSAREVGTMRAWGRRRRTRGGNPTVSRIRERNHETGFEMGSQAAASVVGTRWRGVMSSILVSA